MADDKPDMFERLKRGELEVAPGEVEVYVSGWEPEPGEVFPAWMIVDRAEPIEPGRWRVIMRRIVEREKEPPAE